MKHRPLSILAAVLTLVLTASACADGDDSAGDEVIDSGTASTLDGSTDGTGGDSGDQSTTDGTTSSTTTTEGSSSTGDGATTSTTAAGGATTLPGQPWDGFADPGDVLAVFGVADDDVLNIRAVPGNDGEIVATADPLDDDLVATGEGRQLSRSLWYEVTVERSSGPVTGWVSVAFVAFLGPTDDATAEFLAGGAIPEAETMQDLGELVAAGFASTDPASDIVQSVAPTVGDLGEVTYDVVGLGDDAGAGYRLHVFGTPTAGGEGFALRTIERTSFCLRGVSGEFCV